MKRILFVYSLVVLSLVGCGSDTSSSTNNPQTTGSDSPAIIDGSFTPIVLPIPLSCSLAIAANDLSIGPIHAYDYTVSVTVPSTVSAVHPRLISVSVDGLISIEKNKSLLQTTLAFVSAQPLHPQQKTVTITGVVGDDSGRSAICTKSASVWAY